MDAHGDMYTPQFAMHRNMKLKWDYKINLVGRKDPDPKLHNCEKCNFPIMSYGRMIPCKHVFCFDCAKATDKICLRCGDPVQRIEQSPLGSIYLCTYGAPKHSHAGCRRTYLSQRDLLAHVNHRHMKTPTQSASSVSGKDQGHSVMPRHADQRSDTRTDIRTHQSYVPTHQEGYPAPAPVQSSHVMSEQMSYEPCSSESGSSQAPGPEDYRVNVPVRKSNLITVPLHDSSKDYQQAAKPHTTVPTYNTQAPPMVPVQQQHQAPPPPPPQQHVPYSQHHPLPVSVSHVAQISHPPPASVTYSVPPITGHQVMHSMHPPQGPVYSQPAPHYDNAPRPQFPSSNPIPPPSGPFPSQEVSIPQPGWPVGPPPPSSMPPPPPPPPQTSMPPPPQTSMPPPPPPSQVPPMVNPVPSMPPPQAPVPRTDMGPPPPMIPPMSEASRYSTGQYYM